MCLNEVAWQSMMYRSIFVWLGVKDMHNSTCRYVVFKLFFEHQKLRCYFSNFLWCHLRLRLEWQRRATLHILFVAHSLPFMCTGQGQFRCKKHEYVNFSCSGKNLSLLILLMFMFLCMIYKFFHHDCFVKFYNAFEYQLRYPSRFLG